tara:strand:- start:306 stop:1265 length:960 start_codon:yes stop_codon:yes gene_type:complete
MKIYITGVAGFIGFHLANKLITMGYDIYGIDNLNAYYDIELKNSRLGILKKNKNFHFKKIDINNFKKLSFHVSKIKPNIMYHLAAQAGVRYSIDHPDQYIESNVQGFLNILESLKLIKIQHLIYASSSSVYGSNKNFPFQSSDKTDNPISLYAATKKSNELMANAYSDLFKMKCTGLRFFTVYGPWGRPDMALFKFTKAILENKKIEVYNHGDMIRDFTYIDDVVESLVLLKNKMPPNNHKVYNLGCGSPVRLSKFINFIESAVGRKAKKKPLKMQPGDVKKTFADSEELFKLIKYRPKTSIKEGVEQFVKWYKFFYKT